MAVPGRVEAASILLQLDPPPWFVRHSAGVAEVAAFLAARASASGRDVDPRVVESAALLHDVDKLLPRGDPARRQPHGAGSAAWLTARGLDELASAVSAHPVTALFGDEIDVRALPLEAAIVAYADKRVDQRLVPMSRRFLGWKRRYPVSWTSAAARRAERRARALEGRVCAAAGVGPAEVRRLRWVLAAIAAAGGPS